MTPLQAIAKAESVTCMITPADADGTVYINVTKTEARRLIKEHGLPFDDVMHSVGTVSLYGNHAFITFAT